jgi:hypothetical protein
MVTIFTMMEISMNHQQISYYFFIVAGIMTMAYIIKWVRSKELPHLGKSLGIVLVSGMLGIMVNALALLPVYDFVKYSKRGGQLILDDSKQSNEAEKTKGLSVDYAFQWSYGKAETLTLMFPGTQGYGAKGAELGEKSHVAKYLTEKLNQPEEQATQMAQSFSGSLYWGDQPFTEGPVYLGAIICFLFIFAMVYLKNFHKWWILASCIVAVMMAWGKNFPGFNEFIFNYLPLYNKFRAPTMTLIIPQLLFPLAGILVLQQLLDSKEDMPALNKILKTTAIATISVFAAVILVYMSFDYKNENRSRTEAFNKMIASKTQNMNVQYAQLNSQYPAQKDNQVYESLVSNTQGNTEVAQGILGAIRADRSSVFGKDIFRSFIFVALAFGLLVLCIRKTVSSNVMLTGIALLTFVDLYMVDINFLNETNYIEKDAYETEAFPLSEADKVILQDKDPNYRVLNTMGGDPYQESRTSYYHKSIGGYSPAKLGIYDDLITYQLSGSPNRQVLNMLNTKYIIQQNPQDQKPMPIPNTEALGNVWFVKEIKFVKGASAEMKALTHFNAKDTAIVDETFQKVASIKTVFDSTATIRQVKFDNDAIQYESVSGTPQTAVFSEI